MGTHVRDTERNNKKQKLTNVYSIFLLSQYPII